jgi:transcriptional regulator with XRE-family HTH domain
VRGTVTSPQQHRENFGIRLALAREAAGMTQKQLAERIGLRKNTSISHYETGRWFPLLPVFARLCDVFGVTMDDMWTGENRKDF